jgi:hypothetical protein
MSADQTAGPSRVDDRAIRRAATWLGRHGLAGLAPSPLLATRLRVRRRIVASLFAAVAVIGLVAVLTYGRLGLDGYPADRRTVLARLLGNFAVVLVAVVARWSALRAVRRADRRIGATLSLRVAHPTPPGWRIVLGRRRIAVSAVLYGGALGVGIAALVRARSTQDRLVVGVLLLGLAALAAMTVAEVAEVLRRPALADDAMSLAADDALRGDDARGVIASPLPVALAAFTVTSLPAYETSSLVGFCYALIGFFLVAMMWEQAVTPPSVVPGGRAPASTS